MTEWICRQDAIALSNLSSGHLSRLDASGTVIPKKLGTESHPTVLYTPRQVEELILVAKLRDRCTPGEIRRIVESSRELPCIPKCYVLLFDDSVKWVAAAQIGDAVVSAIGSASVVVKVISLLEDK